MQQFESTEPGYLQAFHARKSGSGLRVGIAIALGLNVALLVALAYRHGWL